MVHLKRVTWKQRTFDDFEILLDISVLSKLTFKSDVFSAFFGSLSTWQDQVQFGYEMREVEEQVKGCDLWYFTPTHETQQSPIITVTFVDCPTRQGRSGSKGAFWTYDVIEALGWVSLRKLSLFFSRREMMIGTLIGTVPSIFKKKEIGSHKKWMWED